MKLLLPILLSAAFSAAGAQAVVTVAPTEAEPGAIVLLSVSDSASDRIVSVRGSMAGEPLRFLGADSGAYRAIGAVPVDASDSVRAVVYAERRSGKVDTMQAMV